jgi:hypothetical protein
MSGYSSCACHDCCEIAIMSTDEELIGTQPFCNECEAAGCADAHAGTGECLVEPEPEEEI